MPKLPPGNPPGWTPPPSPELFPRGMPVQKTEDLQRIVNIPRRKPLDLESIEARAMVEYEMKKYSKHNPDCNCHKLDPQIALGNRSCIKKFLPIQAWALYEMSVAGGLVGSIPVGAGKCLKTAELFDYFRSERRDITEPVGTLEVATFEGSLHVSQASHFASGQKPCVRLELADGSTIEPSTDHPVLTHRGWIHAKELEITDFVAVATEMPAPKTPVEASDAEIKFVAYMLADGGCSQNTMHFTNASENLIADWSEATIALGYKITERPSKSKAREFYVLKGTRNEDKVREKWGLYGLAKNKRAHASVWGLPSHQVALFLNRFWACDGHVSKRGLECTLASEKLIDDLRFLCSRLGVRTRKHFKKSSYVKNGIRHVFDAWRISMRGSAALKFLTEVGPILGKEKACKRLETSLRETRRNTNYDVVPISYKEIQEICDELDLPRKGSAPAGSRPRTDISNFFEATKGQYVSRAKFVEFCKRWEYKGKYFHLATTDVAWERVVKVEDIGIHPVYDLNVPGTHNFVANGIIVHNTLLSVLGALALGEKQTLLLVPPALIEQLILDYSLINEHFRVPSMIVTLSGNRDARRMVPGAPTLHVLPYSLLQGKNNSDWIDRLSPGAIIADEVDALKDLGSARTKRLVRYFTGNERMTPEQRAARSRTKFACWTGSITDSSIAEYAHLAAFSLKANSPVPLDQETVLEWGRCLDAIPNPSPPGALIALCNPGEDVRSAYRRRLSETMGFIVTGTSNVKIAGGETYVRNVIVERELLEIPDIIKIALDKVRNFERPDTLAGAEVDEEILEAMEQARYAQQVSTGMFYKWIYPRREPEDLIKRWLLARKYFRKEQRTELFKSIEFMDSPGLLEDAAKRYWDGAPETDDKGNVLPKWKSLAWPEWRDVKDLVQPKTKAVRLHDFLVRDAIDWATDNKGIVWYNMVEFAQWMGQLSGLPVHEGGPDAARNLRNEKGDRSIIASIKSHGRGRNGLQYLFNNQLVAQTPASARLYEQCLGRLHRQGQRDATVNTAIYMHTPEVRKSFEQALLRAEYVRQTMGQDQKILDGWSGDKDE